MNKNKKMKKLYLLYSILAVVTVSGCAYLGIHGPSILATPEVHSDVSTDSECLECHHLDRDKDTPQTPHPNFTGCIKCHTDPVVERVKK